MDHLCEGLGADELALAVLCLKQEQIALILVLKGQSSSKLCHVVTKAVATEMDSHWVLG